MSRYALTLSNPAQTAKAFAWLKRAADLSWRVEFKEPKRSHAQNDRLWAILSDVSGQAQINGKGYDPDQWKCIFMKQVGRESALLPTLDGESFFPTGFRSSDLSVPEMSDLQTFIEAWAAENGITLKGAE